MSSTVDLDRLKATEGLEALEAPESAEEMAGLVYRQLELLGEDPERD